MIQRFVFQKYVQTRSYTLFRYARVVMVHAVTAAHDLQGEAYKVIHLA